MYDLQSTSLVPHWARRDPLKNESMVRARAKLRMNYVVGMSLLKPRKADAEGWLYFECYESEFERMSQDIETNLAGVEQAKKSSFARMKRMIGEKHRLQLSDDVSQWPEAAQRDVNRYSGSPEAEFYQANLRGILPVIELEKLEVLPPPQTTEQNAISTAVESAVRATIAALAPNGLPGAEPAAPKKITPKGT